MPRIPVVTLTQGIPAVEGPRFPRGYGADGAAEAISRVGQAASDALLRVGDARLREDQQEAGLLASEAEKRIGMADAELRTNQRDPDGYQQDYETLIEQTVKDVSAGARRPNAAALMQTQLIPVLNKNRVAAAQYVEKLRTDQSVATMDAELDNRKQLAGLALSDTEFQRQYEEGANAIKIAPGISADKKGDMARKFREEVLNARALKESHEEPETFAVNADVRYAMLDPKVRESLKEAARKKAEENIKEYERQQDKAEKKFDAEAEKQRQLALTGLSQAGIDKTLTAQQVIDARDRNDIVNPTEFEHFMTLVKKGTAPESDPVLWSAVQADVWGQTPSYTESRIRALMARASEGGSGLSGEHGRMALAELGRKRDHAISEGRTEENQQHSRKTEAYAKAKEEALRSLGITTPMSQLDKKEAKLVSDFEREYNARVLDADGNVRQDISPRQVMTETLPVFMNRQSSDARLNYIEQAAIVGDLVKSTVPDVMDPKFIEWYAQQQKATEPLGADPKTLNIYLLRRDQLLRLARSRAEYLQAEARKAAAGVGGGKSTGGYQAPKEQ